MDNDYGAKQKALMAVLVVATAVIVLGSFIYGRMIGTYYRTTIEFAAASFVDDISGWIDEAEGYFYGVLDLAENPK